MQLSGAGGGLFKERLCWQPEITITKSASYQALTVSISMPRSVDWTREVFQIQPIMASDEQPNTSTMGIVYAPTDANTVTAWMKDSLSSGYTWKPQCILYSLKTGLSAHTWYGQYDSSWTAGTTNNLDIAISEPKAAVATSLVLVNAIHGLTNACVTQNNAYLAAISYRRLNDITMRIRAKSNYGNDQLKYSFTAIY